MPVPGEEEIRGSIEASYRAGRDSDASAECEVPLVLQAAEMVYRAKDYIGAAVVLAEGEPYHVLPMLQLAGQGIELGLKACLASVGITPQRGHDLLGLYDLVRERGFRLDARQYAMVVHVHHYYYSDFATGTKFKTRYPTDRSERLGGAIPDVAILTEAVYSLCEQAQHRSSPHEPESP